MHLLFDVSPSDGEMTVHATYTHKELICPFFYINRDMVFESFLCDGKETKPVVYRHNIAMLNGYTASKIALPTIEDRLEIKYRLKLSGKTGCSPYARERITP